MSRAAMQQALDVLQRASDAGYSIECEEDIAALQAALAQPEPGPLTDEQIENVLRDHYPCESYGDHYRLVKAAYGIRPAPEVRRARPDDTEGGEA